MTAYNELVLGGVLFCKGVPGFELCAKAIAPVTKVKICSIAKKWKNKETIPISHTST